MSIRAGQIIHEADTYVINRIQSAGPGNINIPEERIYEVGNFDSVGTVRDIPDLSFDVESLSVSSEMEALLTGVAPTVAGDDVEYDMQNQVPIDIVSPFKSATNAFDITKGIAIPELLLERASYRFGLRQNATQQFTLKGDSIFYVPDTPVKEVIANDGTVGPFNFVETPVIVYSEGGNTHHAYNVRMVLAATGANKRLKLADDYTSTATGITLVNTFTVGEFDEIHLTYGTTAAVTFPASVHTIGNAQPNSIRGKDIDIYLETAEGSDTLTRMGNVQSFEVNWSVQLDSDEEFGNEVAVRRDFIVPDVTGSIGFRPDTNQDLWDLIEQIAETPASETTGPSSAVPLQIEARLSDPDDGTVLKTFVIPDARFTVPSISNRIQTKLDVTFNFSSDGGDLSIYNGVKP